MKPELPVIRFAKEVAFLPRNYIKTLKTVKGGKRWIGYTFLVLLGFNLLYSVSAQPADALLIPDLTAAGRTIGNGIMDQAMSQLKELYGGSYGALAYICKNCMWLSTPVLAVGLVQYLGDDDTSAASIFHRPALLGAIFYYILMSGGGALYGHLYIFLIEAFEAIIRGMDTFVHLYDAIAQSKAFVSSNAIVSASVAECQKHVGQEQQRCIAEATNKAVEHLESFKSGNLLWDWLMEDIDQLKQIGANILSPDKSLVEKAQNIFYAWAAPGMEIDEAARATTSITTFTAIYAAVVIFVGLGGPIMGLSSLIVPVLQSGWIAFVTALFALFYWRFSYLMLMWILSEMLTKAPASATMSIAWFSDAESHFAPVLAAAIAGGMGLMTWIGISGSISSGVLGEDVKGAASEVTSAPPPPSSAPSVGGSSAPVKTDY